MPPSYHPLNQALEEHFQPLLVHILSGKPVSYHLFNSGSIYEDTAPSYTPARYVTTWKNHLHCAEHPFGRWIEAAAAEMRANFVRGELAQMTAEMFFDPYGWWYDSTRLAAPKRQDDVAFLKHAVLARLLVDCPPADIATRLERRIRRMVIEHDPFEATGEVYWSTNHLDELNTVFLPPNLRECLDLLYSLPPSPALLDLMVALWQGLIDNPDAPPITKLGYAGTAHQDRTLAQSLLPMARRLDEAGRLEYDLFREFVYCHRPTAIVQTRRNYLKECLSDSPELADKLTAFRDRLLTESAANLSVPVHRQLIGMYGEALEGPQWALFAARWAAGAKLKKPLNETDHGGPPPDYIPNPAGIAKKLVQAQVKFDPRGDEPGRVELVAALCDYPPAALKALLPQAGSVRWPMLEALGWQSVISLLDLFFNTLDGWTTLLKDVWITDWMSGVPECSHPKVGVLDSAAVHAAIAADPQASRDLLDLFAQARRFPRLVMLFQAVPGWNRAEVLDGLAKRSHAAIRAYGLLPLTSENESAERRAALEQIAVGAGLRPLPTRMNEKKANLNAAITAALENLDQVEGMDRAGGRRGA